jgi:hypothetical protein
MNIHTRCDDLKTGNMNNRLALYVLAGLCFATTLVSCSKNDTTVPIATGNFQEFKNWMNANVKKQSWADANYFYWKTSVVKLNGVAVASNGIAYMNNPSSNAYPALEQTSNGYLRSIELGNPYPVHCDHYREIFSATTLIIKTTDGKIFRWNNCPIKVSEHESNPSSTDWKITSPSSIEVLCEAAERVN